MKPLIIRDPVHDLIRIDCPYAKRLVSTAPFQRLRRIKQLGLANLVYPGAEHTRFNHSLGVYHLSQVAMDSIDTNLAAIGKTPKFDPRDLEGKKRRLLLGLCALVHDVGHGPFSHMFERVAKEILGDKARKHEKWTIEILETDGQVRKILDEAAEKESFPDLVEKMKQVYDQIYTPDYVVDLLSSQLDVDRFDYMIRDSRNAGCHYGDFDLKWVLRSLLVWDATPQKILKIDGEDNASSDSRSDAVREVLAVHDVKGRNCVEECMLGRHYLYVHLYYHKTIVGAEALLQSILKRAAFLIFEKRLPGEFGILNRFAAKENPDLSEYLDTDDNVVMGWVASWAKDKTEDIVLRDLSRRLLNRDLFAKVSVPKDPKKNRHAYQAILEALKDRFTDPDYYLLETSLSDSAHKDYLWYVEAHKPEKFRDVYIYSPEDDTVLKLSDLKGRSVVIAGSSALKYEEVSWYVPKEFETEARRIMESYA